MSKPQKIRGATAQTGFTTLPREGDPYRYQAGFGNRFASEAIPGTLPDGCNAPQRIKWDLYSEQINGTGFISSRDTVQNVWLYRIRPAVAHKVIQPGADHPDLVADFSPLNPQVHITPKELVWPPTKLPSSDDVDFVQGIKTLCGSGEPGDDEGLAVHVYACTASMKNKSFASLDGDMLIMPQQGRLDIQTEMGHLMVRPGEIVVIQRGIRFKVDLPDGPARGYIQEVYGTHYQLAELGPVGTNGMALPRDFESPVASFDLDNSEWTCTYKMCAKIYQYTQNHTPFDVVAWHGNYVPYKYNMEKFVNIGCLDKEQMDPSIYCVLMAKSRRSGVSLTELLIFTPKWSVATNTFRPPYYHRNTFTELYGMVYGKYAGSAKNMVPGALSYESSFIPHGNTYDSWKQATTEELTNVRVGEGTIGFMFHTSRMLTVTDYAFNRAEPEGNDEDMWDDLVGHFYDHVDEIQSVLKENGLPLMEFHQPPTNGMNGVNGIH